MFNIMHSLLFAGLIVFLRPTFPLATAAMSEAVVVAGAGPASLLFARRYLELHPSARLHIYEKRGQQQNMDSEGTSSSMRTYDSAFGFGIGQRAQRCLQKAGGVDLLCAVGEKAVKTPHGLWLVNRADLCEVMTKHLIETCEGRVQITYGARVTGIQQNKGGEPPSSRAEIKFDNGDTSIVPYALLVAADGSNSSIRKDLLKKRKLKQKRYLRPVSWKALQLPAQPKLPLGSFVPILPEGSVDSFGAVLPRHPDKFVALLFWRYHDQRNPFNSETPEQLKEAMKQAFPQVTQFPPNNELEAFLQNSPGKEYYMKLDRHIVEELSVALIGDAATGVYSMLGQGCACAFESANRLAEKLQEVSITTNGEHGRPQIGAALRDFSVESKREGHSLSDLNLLAHLTYSRFFARFNLFQIQDISQQINDPANSYTDLLKQFRWKVRLGKLHWRFTRKLVRD